MLFWLINIAYKYQEEILRTWKRG